MNNPQLQQAYFEKLLKISQKHKELMYKDASELFDIAGDMVDGKYRKNNKLFKLIYSNN